MTVESSEYTTTEKPPVRPFLGFKISVFEWKVEVWKKNRYVSTESKSLLSAFRVAWLVWRGKA